MYFNFFIPLAILANIVSSTPQYTRKYADFSLESGTHIVQSAENLLHIVFPNGTTINMDNGGINKSNELQLSSSSSLPQQWLAWYFKSALNSAANGFTSFSSVFEVPPVPTKSANLAIFNALQASYDPTPYNWILQPVLSVGTWMLGTSKTWTLSSVMCNPNGGHCQFTTPIPTQPGNKILGVITQLSGSPNSYQYEINITDITDNTPTQTLLFSSAYFAPWAFVSLEHTPEGKVSDCSTLPDADAVVFTENVLKPTSVDMWQGSQNEFSCGISVDTFPMNGDSKLEIKL